MATILPFLPFAVLEVRTVYNSLWERATSSRDREEEQFSG